jgi:hydroxyacylglutathione hydrolase
VPAGSLVQWAGFFVDYDKPVYLLTESATLENQLRSLRSIGIDHVGGFFDAKAVESAGLRTASYPNASPQDLKPRIDSGEMNLVDVRAETEFSAGHIAGAKHHFLGRLLREAVEIDRTKPIVAQCLGGGRSAIATSVLRRAGFDVTNMQGGYKAWVGAGLPVVRGNA